MSDALETKTVRGYTVEVFHDDACGIQPFECGECPSWGIDLSRHRDYGATVYGVAMPIPLELVVRSIDDCEAEELSDLMDFLQGYYFMPLSIYEHSGRSISSGAFGTPFEPGMDGLVYVRRYAFTESGYFGVSKTMPEATRAKLAEKYLEATVRELDYHFRGQIYGYVVTDPDGEEVDSCWGYVGELEYCLAEGVAAAKLEYHYARKQRRARLKGLLRNRVPLNERHLIMARY